MGQGRIFVGTTKGLFLVDEADGNWSLRGPYLAGREVPSVCPLPGGTVLAGVRSEHWGPAVARSDDGGATWQESEAAALRFPEDTGAAVERIWQLAPGPDGAVFAGVEPAALFASSDGGTTFELVRGLWDHPHRPQWQPGGGGLCLHTILADEANPERLWVAISTGGVYRTEDGGRTWLARNRGIATPFLPGDEPPEFGQCVHKVDRHPAHPDRLFLQHHWGVYRSDDAGDSWTDIGEALPSDFGFPLVVDPDDPDGVSVIPLDSDGYRATAEGRCRVYRSPDAGATWEAQTDGLPQEQAHLCVLRDAFSADGGQGRFFGTRTGEVFASLDRGRHWSAAARHLPPVLCVRASTG